MTRTSRGMLALAALAAIVFTAFPQIDIAVAHLFYDGAGGFRLAENPVVRAIFFGITWLTNVAVAGLLVAIVVGALRRSGFWRTNLPKAGFLLLAMAIGPGLIVNSGLKDNWGRARPSQVAEFGGNKHFTPALLPTNQCDRNCSFVSGHIAIAFFPAVVALVAPRRRRRWLYIGAGGAALAAFGRMASGSHFLSDALFSVAIVWFSATLLHWLLFAAYERRRSAQPSAATPSVDMVEATPEWPKTAAEAKARPGEAVSS